MNRHSALPQSLHGLLQRRVLQLSTTPCCSHLEIHTPCCCYCQRLWVLPTPPRGSLPLPRALQTGAASATSPRVLAIVKHTATRHWLPALPIASISLETHAAPYQGVNSLLTLRKETANIQTPMPKINSNPPKIQRSALA